MFPRGVLQKWIRWSRSVRIDACRILGNSERDVRPASTYPTPYAVRTLDADSTHWSTAMRPSEEELRSMPMLDHLTELRSRLIRAAAGFAVAYAVSLTFTHPLWTLVRRPAAQALTACIL